MTKDKRDSLTILEQATIVRSRAEEISAKENIDIGKAFDIACKEFSKEYCREF